MFFGGKFTTLAYGQFLPALAWGIAALQDADQPTIKRGLCLTLVEVIELLTAADWKILINRPKLRIIYGIKRFLELPRP